MATIEVDIDVEALDASGKRGRNLVKYAHTVLKYDGEKLLQVAIYSGAPYVDAVRAASMLGFQSKTLNKWASYGCGPIEPCRVNGRAYWRICNIRELLGR